MDLIYISYTWLQVAELHPLMGVKESLDCLVLEYKEDLIYKTKSEKLCDMYTSIRRVRPDGNCFYRGWGQINDKSISNCLQCCTFLFYSRFWIFLLWKITQKSRWMEAFSSFSCWNKGSTALSGLSKVHSWRLLWCSNFVLYKILALNCSKHNFLSLWM